MALKWKKDGTAKCGRLEVNAQANGYPGGFIFVVDSEDFGTCASSDEWGEIFNTKADARIAAESWLRKQAAKMLKDLNG